MVTKTRITRKIVGSDYSAQEPRMTAHLSDQFCNTKNPYYDMTDPKSTELCGNKMKEAYQNKKDLYAMIAMSAFDNNYEDNLEFWPEGTEIEIDGKKIICGNKTHKNPAGKERRSVGKVLNLAATYGMGGATAGARLGKSKEEGEQLLFNFFKGFPNVKLAIEYSKQVLKETGCVEDFFGRQRHLPEIDAVSYEVKPINEDNIYNPILICNRPRPESKSVSSWKKIVELYVAMAQSYEDEFNPNWRHNGEMSSRNFDDLYKLALNPFLWHKPCKSLEQIDDMIKHGVKPNTWARYVKCRPDKKISNANFSTKPSSTFTEAGPVKIISAHRHPITDANENYIPITYAEKLASDIAEYLYIIIPAARARANAAGKPSTVPEDIDTNFELPKEPVLLIANTGRRAQAERQCFNARIQGGAATLTKLAMIGIDRDKLLNDCHAKLIIPVHDELLVECPAFYADTVEQRLPEVMCEAAVKGGITEIPQSCDPYNVDRWYIDEYSAMLTDEYKKLLAGNTTKGIKPYSRDEAIEIVINNHVEAPADAIKTALLTGNDVVF